MILGDSRQRLVDKEESREVLVYILLERLLKQQVLAGIRRCRDSRRSEARRLELHPERQLVAVGTLDGVHQKMYEVIRQDDIRKVYKPDGRQMAYEQDDLVVGREVSLWASQEVFLLPFQELLQKSLQGFLLGLALEQLPE